MTAYTQHWIDLLNKKFLSLYESKSEPQLIEADFDHIFKIGDRRVCLMLINQQIESRDDNLSNEQLESVHKEIVQKARERHEVNLQKINNLVDDNINNKSNDKDNNKVDQAKIYFIAISSIIKMGNKGNDEKVSEPDSTSVGLVNHGYGSDFLNTNLYAKSDNTSDIVQLFSFNSFVAILELLPTPSDFIEFLAFHRYVLIQKVRYVDETKLASTFILQPVFFNRAIEVQKKLVETNLLEKVETRLLKASQLKSGEDSGNSKDDQQFVTKLLNKMHQYSGLYHRICNTTVKQMYQQSNTLSLNIVQLLIKESMYTRMSIMEEVMAYTTRPRHDQKQGLERHLHSYDDFGRHYMLVFYATESNAYFSKSHVASIHNELLQELNEELQNPMMDDLFLLGFDINLNQNNDIKDIQMDVFYQKGMPINLRI